MIRLLRKLGIASTQPPPAKGSILSRVYENLRRLSPERIEYVAAFAGLLARVAYADCNISAEEMGAIKRLVRQHARLEPAELEIVADIVCEQTAILGGIENHFLTRAFNEQASEEEKELLVDCLYAVAGADRLVSNAEDQEIRRIAHALLLAHSTVMDIRSRYRDRLEALQYAKRQQR